ncbi:acyl-CoA dehydrogenase family protein [Cytobacillus massiliigabonensis]|uniref:hypothetical protein n=1 Tax=Cytobacillus massiliigabonensis TaxID=1871011 RepID=UPI0015E0E6C9|nr:hypothetical protein [Cytobacillus massiliigabonensis]
MSNVHRVVEQISYVEAIKRAKSLATIIRERGKQAEELRQQPKETIQEIVDSGLIRLLQPKKWGGHELFFDSLVDTTIEIAKADPSSGWCFTLLGLHSFMLAGWPEKAQEDVWSKNPNALITSAFAPIGKMDHLEDGVRLSGSWSFSSGVDHSEWAMVGAFQPPEKAGMPPKHLMLLVPREDYQIIDDWHVAGIEGSGSKTITIVDAFVPNYRIVDLVGWSKFNDIPGTIVNKAPMYKLPVMTVIGHFLASAVLGAALGAYDLWKETSKKKVAIYTQNQVTQFTHQQIRLSECSVELDAADAILHQSIEQLRTTEHLTAEKKVLLARNFAYVAKVGSKVTGRLFENSGASSIYSHNPMQRFWRDTQIMSMHAALNFDMAGENFGRVELGVPLDPKNILI